MVIKLKQIPEILEIVKQFEEDKKAEPKIDMVKKTYNNSPVSEATFPDFDQVGSFCIETQILKLEKNILSITKIGKEILDSYQENKSISNKVKEIIATKCILEGPYSQQIQEAFSHFLKNDGKIWCPSNQVMPLFSTKFILPLLYESNILLQQNKEVIINPKYSNLFKIEKKTRNVRITQKQIDQKLQLMKKVGEIAEEIVVDYEKKRLKNKGFLDESKNVKRISQGNASAGYDIESFNEKSEDINVHDRLIEVKGSTGTEFDIHWSSNEIKIAKDNPDKYYLYFVSEINLEKRSSPNEPETIEDPFSKILDNPEEYEKKVEGYHITKKKTSSLDNNTNLKK